MNLNPYALGGPAFLAFYVALMVVTVVALRRVMRAAEIDAAPPLPRLDDPYLIACLRGGEDEAVRVATVSLIDRGLLAVDGDRLALRDPQAMELARRDLERAVLRAYRTAGDADRALKDAGVRDACRRLHETLDRHGLLAGAAAYARRLQPIGVAAAVLLGVSLARIVQALSHGRTNLGFLVVLTLVAVVVLLVHWRRRRTFAGDAVLADLRTLFQRLKARASTISPGGASSDFVLLAAVFGLAAVPGATFPYVEKLYPRSQSDSGGGGGCGSSCGSSCGGGCGGGGCGGD